VALTFWTDQMGDRVRTDCAGNFTATRDIPNPGSYSVFGPKDWTIITEEYDSHDAYVGNGTTATYSYTG
jgi:hypothetical protein